LVYAEGVRTEAARPYSRLTVVLGPTNTGKTHRAITRMLEHPSGMLGLPLRLLAREVYDRITRELGEQAVALMTGEEKRIGARARYWVCTVEAMPPQEVDFLAVDEIQLAAHPQRGHVFTDRLLKARGRVETWFLGADTIRSLIPVLLPTASIEGHARLSTLRGKGQSRMGALPSRSAVVAFNIPDVYRIAEQLRHRRGGAAVVHGGLSPRARNAQVALYEAQEVDYLVATDAIGMGLNLNIRHVAFAGLRKFDGREERPLAAAELGQIAGRAGRYLQDGSFGTLAPVPALPEGLRRSIEDHHFEKLGQLSWRNSDLDLSSVEALLASLHRLPPRPYFSRTKSASDVEALERLALDPEVSRRARGEDNLGLLWQACQIPDYRQSLPELHAELVKDIFLQLTGPAAAIDESWLETSLRPLDDIAGDIDALTTRIASVRNWTYLSNHSSWVPNARHWVERTRDIEDRLSDALHERLVERFVERRRAIIDLGAAAPVRGKERSRQPRASAEPEPERGPFAALQELRLRMAAPADTPSTERWVEDLVAAPHERFRLDASGRVFDDQRELGRLSRGNTLLRPALELTLPGLDSGQRLRLVRRLSAWSRDLVNDVVGDLSGSVASGCSPAARGLLYQLEQNLGSLPAHAAGQQVAALTALDHGVLRALGVRVSRVLTYVTGSLRPRQRLTRLALTRTFAPRPPELLGALQQRVSIPRPPGIDAEWLCCVGFVLLGPRAVRIDVADRVSVELARQAKNGAFELPAELAQWLGCSSRDAADLALVLGYRRGQDGVFRGPRRRKRMKRQQKSSA
jgi:ATP-dependent RNA helicase SUPV3L1/SUV3